MGRVVAMEQAAEEIGLLYDDVKVEGGGEEMKKCMQRVG